MREYLKYGFALFSIIGTILLATQNIYISRENDRINHRLDVRDAYFNKGLIERNNKLEQRYKEEREQITQILKHCETAKCGLPNEIATLKEQPQLESLESILLKP